MFQLYSHTLEKERRVNKYDRLLSSIQRPHGGSKTQYYKFFTVTVSSYLSMKPQCQSNINERMIINFIDSFQ